MRKLGYEGLKKYITKLYKNIRFMVSGFEEQRYCGKMKVIVCKPNQHQVDCFRTLF